MAKNVVEKIDDAVAIKHALISVADKGGLDVLVPGLIELCPDITLYSTGGTHEAIATILGAAASKHLVSVSDYTGQLEMQGGLVKTLDFKIYLGLLSETYNEDHRKDLQRAQAVPIDLVVVNLYPFVETISNETVTLELARSNIDIGGPCMVRAAAKNYLRVASVTDPADYEAILQELRTRDGVLTLATRFYLARKAFAHTAEYDGAIAAYLHEKNTDDLGRGYQLAGS